MKLTNALNDKGIEEKMISEHHSLFKLLYEKYSSKIFGFLISRTESNERAEALLIKVFSKVWEQITAFDDNEEKKIMAILFSICRDNQVSTNRLLAP